MSLLNLSAMFDTFYTWVQEGAAEIEEEHINYPSDGVLANEIAKRLNPGIRAV